MRIETAATPGSPPKVKGDLLEDLSAKLLRRQDYEVTQQIRFTATELDLLCEHRVNRKRIYVECKAYRDNVNSAILKNLLGTVIHKGYQEGWLISASPLGKDAKGFQDEHEQKPVEERQRLSIYTPERVIESLISSGTIQHHPENRALDLLGSPDFLGEWTLLITEFGIVWAITCLQAGVPTGVLAFSATTGQLIDNVQHLRNLASTDSTLTTLDFEYLVRLKGDDNSQTASHGLERVVEVQHGESWTDLPPSTSGGFRRPSRISGRHYAILKDSTKPRD